MFDEEFLMSCSAPSALQQFLYIFMNIIVLGTLKQPKGNLSCHCLKQHLVSFNNVDSSCWPGSAKISKKVEI